MGPATRETGATETAFDTRVGLETTEEKLRVLATTDRRAAAEAADRRAAAVRNILIDVCAVIDLVRLGCEISVGFRGWVCRREGSIAGCKESRLSSMGLRWGEELLSAPGSRVDDDKFLARE